MKRSTVLILGLFLTLISREASATDVTFNCAYELGTETEAKRRKIGTVVVAIDVKAKTAKVDFGKGWFKSVALMVDGTDVKETGPPVSGVELGYFYFDLTGNSGGFAGEGDLREFFDECVRIANDRVADTAVAPPASNSASAKEAAAPSAAPPALSEMKPPSTAAPATTEHSGSNDTQANAAPVVGAAQPPEPGQDSAAPLALSREPAPKPADTEAKAKHPGDGEEKEAATSSAEAPPTPGRPQAEAAALPAPLPPPNKPPTRLAERRGTTEFFGGKATPETPSPAPKAELAPIPPKEALAPVASAAGSAEESPPPSGGPGTTEYFGSGAASEKPAPAPEVVRGSGHETGVSGSEKEETGPEGVSSATDDAIEPCRAALSVEAAAAKVNFANSSFGIVSDSRRKLRKIAEIIKDCRNVGIEVDGHTDNLGSSTVNQRLSLLRAEAVVRFLISEGVNSSKLKAVGYGQEQPIATNETAEGRRSNRRVELHVSTNTRAD